MIVLLAVNVKDLTEDIVSGQAKAYSQSIENVRQILTSDKNQDADVTVTNTIKNPNISSGSGFLVSIDEKHWVNRCVAMYHKNKSVRLKP